MQIICESTVRGRSHEVIRSLLCSPLSQSLVILLEGAMKFVGRVLSTIFSVHFIFDNALDVVLYLPLFCV